MTRFFGVLTCFAILTACNATHVVEDDAPSEATVAELGTKTKIKLREISSNKNVTVVVNSEHNSTTSVEVIKPKSIVQSPIKLDPKVDQSDLAAVTSYCEEFSLKALYLKESCKSSSDRKVCKSAQFGNATFVKEFNYCLKQHGWEVY